MPIGLRRVRRFYVTAVATCLALTFFAHFAPKAWLGSRDAYFVRYWIDGYAGVLFLVLSIGGFIWWAKSPVAARSRLMTVALVVAAIGATRAVLQPALAT